MCAYVQQIRGLCVRDFLMAKTIKCRSRMYLFMWQMGSSSGIRAFCLFVFRLPKEIDFLFFILRSIIDVFFSNLKKKNTGKQGEKSTNRFPPSPDHEPIRIAALPQL